MYWRKPDGFIVIAPAWPTEFMKRVKQGFEPLNEYGEFYLDKVKGMQAWSAHREPYRQIFARGGADAFTVAQVLEHGWDLKAPYPQVRFPQLDGLDVARSKCNHCSASFVDGEPWGLMSGEDRLDRHVQLQHKEKSANDSLARAIGNSQGEITEGLSSVLQMMADRMASQDEVMSEVLSELRASRARAPKATTKRKAAKAA